MEKEIVNEVQEAQRVPYRINPRRNTPRHILIKLTKTKHIERILKAAREKKQVTCKGNPICFTADLSAVKCMGFPLYVACCFSLTVFNNLCLCLVFVSLISMCLGVFLLGFMLYGTLCASWTCLTFLFHVGEIFNYNLLKIFLTPFLFSSFPETPII